MGVTITPAKKRQMIKENKAILSLMIEVGGGCISRQHAGMLGEKLGLYKKERDAVVAVEKMVECGILGAEKRRSRIFYYPKNFLLNNYYENEEQGKTAAAKKKPMATFILTDPAAHRSWLIIEFLMTTNVKDNVRYTDFIFNLSENTTIGCTRPVIRKDEKDLDKKIGFIMGKSSNACRQIGKEGKLKLKKTDLKLLDELNAFVIGMPGWIEWARRKKEAGIDTVKYSTSRVLQIAIFDTGHKFEGTTHIDNIVKKILNILEPYKHTRGSVISPNFYESEIDDVKIFLYTDRGEFSDYIYKAPINTLTLEHRMDIVESFLLPAPESGKDKTIFRKKQPETIADLVEDAVRKQKKSEINRRYYEKKKEEKRRITEQEIL